MRVLLTGKFTHLGSRPIGGLQSWIKTIGAELERRGHEVDYKEPHELDGTKYDLGIFANIKLTGKAVQHCKRSVLVSHGIIHAEKPDYSCDRLMFVSEGVRDHWEMDGEIIRQPIDLDFWKAQRLIKNKLTRYSYRQGNMHCKKVSEALDLPFYHAKDMTHEQARDVINSSCLVFATGRAALESMACDVPTVIYDHRDAYQPPLMGQNLLSEMKNSYSGRSGFTPTAEKVIAQCKFALDQNRWREWVANHHDVRKIVDQLC